MEFEKSGRNVGGGVWGRGASERGGGKKKVNQDSYSFNDIQTKVVNWAQQNSEMDIDRCRQFD